MKSPQEWTYAGLAFAVLLATYHWIFGSYFPLPNGLIGHDYALTLSSFEDGYLWFRGNGFLSPPWFTPSFCAGQPYFADPQSAFYSVPQFLAFFVNPLTAAYISILLFAGLGFWGSYVLARNTFDLSIWSSLVVSTVFMFNGFYSHRMIVGHFGYQPYMLVPWVAYLLIGTRPTNRLNTWPSVVLAGLLIGYWLQAGMATLMVPAGLSVIALGCLVTFRNSSALVRMFLRGIAASLIALCLSAAKLSANIALMSHFSRDYYPLPGIEGVGGVLKFVFEALFYSSEHVYHTVTPLWQNMRWAALPHELAYGVTVIPLAILLTGGALHLIARMQGVTRTQYDAIQWLSILLLTAILSVPISLVYYSPEWNAALKQIPLVGSTTSPYRWMIVYIPVLSVLAGIAAEAKPEFAKVMGLACLVGIPALNAMEGRLFYQRQSYDPSAVLRFDQAVRSGSIQPMIHSIALPRSHDGAIVIDNSLFTVGASPLVCYNPVFGYRLEKYSTGALGAGGVFSLQSDGHLNFRNPACLVFPDENQCKVWDAFKAEERDKLENFVRYRPFEFEVSSLQKISSVVTELSLLGCVLFLLVLVLRKLIHK